MKHIRFVLTVILVGAGLSTAWSADVPGKAPGTATQVPPVNISTAPISSGNYVTPGSYSATIAPSLNMEMAGRLKKALAKVPGLTATDASSTDSTVRFTVKEGARIRVADIQEIIAKVNTGAVMTAPMPEGAATPKPGL